MNRERCCGTCRFRRILGWNPESDKCNWFCVCEDAEEYGEETGYYYGQECPKWEGSEKPC